MLEPGAATRELHHAGELVAIVQEGAGRLQVDGGPQRFHAPCSLLMPAGCGFQVTNNGSVPLQLPCVVFTQAPKPVGDDAPSASRQDCG